MQILSHRIDFASARTPLHAGRRLLVLVALLCSSWAASAMAQDEPAAPATPEEVHFDTVEACSSFATEMDAVLEESARLAEALPEKIDSREVLLAGIFQGTRDMLAYGEHMFQASDLYEEKCKAALREAGRADEIAGIYERVVEPALRGYAFLVRVRDGAKALDDQQTVTEMEEAMKGYKSSTLQLISLCEQDLPEDAAAVRCGELRKQLDAAFE